VNLLSIVGGFAMVHAAPTPPEPSSWLKVKLDELEFGLQRRSSGQHDGLGPIKTAINRR
jgi:hypothetical protein